MLLSLKDDGIQASIDKWAAAGWELHSSSVVQLGGGYGIKSYLYLMWQREATAGPPGLSGDSVVRASSSVAKASVWAQPCLANHNPASFAPDGRCWECYPK